MKFHLQRAGECPIDIDGAEKLDVRGYSIEVDTLTELMELIDHFDDGVVIGKGDHGGAPNGAWSYDVDRSQYDGFLTIYDWYLE